MKVADTLFGQHMRVRLKSVIPQALRLNCAAVSVASEDALRGILRSVGESNEPELPGESPAPLNDDFEVLCHSMERLFKHGLKPIRYKVRMCSVEFCYLHTISNDFNPSCR